MYVVADRFQPNGGAALASLEEALDQGVRYSISCFVGGVPPALPDADQ